MVKPKVINDAAVLTQAMSVRSCESNVAQKKTLLLASAAIAAFIDNSAGIASFWLVI